MPTKSCQRLIIQGRFKNSAGRVAGRAYCLICRGTAHLEALLDGLHHVRQRAANGALAEDGARHTLRNLHRLCVGVVPVALPPLAY